LYPGLLSHSHHDSGGDAPYTAQSIELGELSIEEYEAIEDELLERLEEEQ